MTGEAPRNPTHLAFIQQLAQRLHLLRDEFARRHPGRSVPITDTLSRLLEHAPSYRPPRPRRPNRSARPPLIDPRISTIRRIAADLEVTVAELIGEAPPALRPIDTVTAAQRRTLREALGILHEVFDLRDPRLDDELVSEKACGNGSPMHPPDAPGLQEE